MKKIACTLLCFLLLIVPNTMSNILYLPQGFVIESLSGYGYNNSTLNSAINVSNSNPALMYDCMHPSFGISYQFDTKIQYTWPYDWDYYRKHSILPQSASIVIPLNHFRFGIGFSQKFNLVKDYGEATGTLVDKTAPLGYVDYVKFTLIHENFLYDYSASICYGINNILTKDDNLILGMHLKYYYLYYKSYEKDVYFFNVEYAKDYVPYQYKDSTTKFGYTFGLRYDIRKLKVGISYDKGAKFNNDLDGFLPDKIYFGVLTDIIQPILLTGNFNYIFWNDHEKNVKDRLEYSGNILLTLTNNIIISSGFFISDYQSDSTLDYYKRFQGIYLTFGTILSFGIFDIDMSIADSHWFSEDWCKQTIAKIGIVATLK